MKRLLLFVLLAVFCRCDDMMDEECSPGKMRCHDNVSQMCSADHEWEDYQDCDAVAEVCTSDCSGYSGITCCR